MSVFAVKLLLVPALIALITFTGRRFGPVVAGWMSGFPVIAGPILLIVAIERGSAFVSHAAVGTLSAVPAAVAFALAYAWASQRFDWPRCLLAGLVAYGITVALMNALAPGLLVAAVFGFGAPLAARRSFPRVSVGMGAGASPHSRADLAWRMLAGVVLMFVLTESAPSLGPRLSGLLAQFPVLGSILAVFSHRQSGRDFTVALLRSMMLGFYAFAVFCLVLSLSVSALGVALGFALAFACSGITQVVAPALVRLGGAMRSSRTPS